MKSPLETGVKPLTNAGFSYTIRMLLWNDEEKRHLPENKGGSVFLSEMHQREWKE